MHAYADCFLFRLLNLSLIWVSTVNCPRKHKQVMRPGLSGFSPAVSSLSSSPLPANPRVLLEKQRNPSASTPSLYYDPGTVSYPRKKHEIRPPRQFPSFANSEKGASARIDLL